MNNPHQATIDLFKSVLAGLTAVFSASRKTEMEKTLAELSGNGSAALAEIESKLIEFGKEIWPYQEAYEVFYKLYGEAREREAMRAKLSESARVALDKFLSEGGSVEGVREGDKFETFFSADIRAEIVTAELDAHDGVQAEMEALIAGEKNADFIAILGNQQEKLAKIIQKIKEFSNLAGRSEKWGAEIADKAHNFELGFAFIEVLPSLEAVNHEIQYYVDIMDV
jgi:hypothetical protein